MKGCSAQFSSGRAAELRFKLPLFLSPEINFCASRCQEAEEDVWQM